MPENGHLTPPFLTVPNDSALYENRRTRRVTGSWGCAVRRRLIAQCRNSSDLLLPRPIESFGIAPEDRPDAIVRCSPPGSGYSPIGRDLAVWSAAGSPTAAPFPT